MAAVAGGALASASLAASALLGAALTGRLGARASGARRLHRLAFLAGGPVTGLGWGAGRLAGLGRASLGGAAPGRWRSRA